jgi:hypothetical protein
MSNWIQESTPKWCLPILSISGLIWDTLSLNYYFHKSNHCEPNNSGPSPFWEISIHVHRSCGWPKGSTAYCKGIPTSPELQTLSPIVFRLHTPFPHSRLCFLTLVHTSCLPLNPYPYSRHFGPRSTYTGDGKSSPKSGSCATSWVQCTTTKTLTQKPRWISLIHLSITGQEKYMDCDPLWTSGCSS